MATAGQTERLEFLDLSLAQKPVRRDVALPMDVTLAIGPAGQGIRNSHCSAMGQMIALAKFAVCPSSEAKT